jgi:hypothetical protein
MITTGLAQTGAPTQSPFLTLDHIGAKIVGRAFLTRSQLSR